MEKDRSLDASGKALALTLLALVLLSCSLPKIITLKDPLTPEEHINLGLSYEQKGEFGPALEHYEEASGKLPIAYLYIGNLHFQRNEFDKAESAYKKAIKKTNDPQAYNNLAWLYLTIGTNLDKARELAEKAVSLSPNSEDFRDTLQRIRER